MQIMFFLLLTDMLLFVNACHLLCVEIRNNEKYQFNNHKIIQTIDFFKVLTSSINPLTSTIRHMLKAVVIFLIHKK